MQQVPSALGPASLHPSLQSRPTEALGGQSLCNQAGYLWTVCLPKQTQPGNPSPSPLAGGGRLPEDSSAYFQGSARGGDGGGYLSQEEASRQEDL